MKHILLSITLLFFIPVFSQYKNQSIGFKKNKGQIIDQRGKANNAVMYLLNTGGLNVQLRKNGFSYDIYEVKKIPLIPSKTAKILPYHIPEKGKETKPEFNLEYIFHRIDIDFVNSNSKVELITDQESKDFDNYYNVPNKPEGIVGVHQYQQITYKNIYPNIDVVFIVPKDSKKTVEYNFIVHPKGKISDIQLKFKGAETDLIDNKIQMNVRFGEMEETLPASWTEEGTSKKEIAVGYTKIKKNVYGFATSENVTEKTVIIDPVPVRLWGTYYGGNENDMISKITTDSTGSIYIAGITHSSDNITTAGAFQTSLTPLISEHFITYDCFIAKFDNLGNRLWGTYIGGNEQNELHDLVTDNQNNIIIGGVTNSKTNNFTTPGSHQQLLNYNFYTSFNNFDAFLVKFNSNGLRLWGTFYGGYSNDVANSVTTDGNNNIIISGLTFSETNIATSNCHKFNFSNSGNTQYDGFIAKFDSNGNRLWGTYFGGNIQDEIIESHTDINNNIYLVGKTGSDSDIATNGSFQTNKNNDFNSDGFLTKFSPNGNQIWGTYFGGENYDDLSSIKVSTNNFIYISGKTFSDQNISTPNSFLYHSQHISNQGYDGIIAKFDITGNRIWSSYFPEQIIDIDIDTNDNIFFCGATTLDIGIATQNAFQMSESFQDSYIQKFSPNGERLWGTYYGGESSEYSEGITFDKLNNYLYLGGYTTSSNGISTINSHQPIYSGGYDSFLVQFQDCLSNPLVSSNSPICIGNTLELKASGGTDYSWTGPNGFTSTEQNPIIANAASLNSGEYSCTITGTAGCDDTKKIDVVVGDFIAPVPNLVTLPTITGDCHTTITTFPTATDACAGAIIGTTTNPLSYTLPGTYTIVWNYDDGNGNNETQNQTVTISSQPLATVTSPQSFCVQKNATLDNIDIATGQNIKWYDALTAGNLLSNTTLLEGNKTYYASQTINGCESEKVAVTINIQDTPAPTGDANQPFCSGQNPTLENISITGENIKWYNALNNGNLLSSTANLQNGQTYYSSQTVNSCEGERLAVTISIQNTPSIPTGDTNPKFCKSEKATLNSIAINEPGLRWYSSDTATNPLANTTLVQNNTTYYVSQTIGCESDRLAVLVNVNETSLPTANTSQTFCIDKNPTIANINIAGQNLIWYDSATAGNILTNATTLENRTYYATQTSNNCESEKLPVVIKIQDTQPPVGDANQSFCIQQNATISKIKISGEDIKWYNIETVEQDSSQSILLENGKTYYATQTINNCESEMIQITIQIFAATTADCINYIDELPYPKFFTPNNDTYNDTWTIDFGYLAPNSGIRIFDRYGKLIKILNLNQTWDGTFNGHNLPSSDYWFVVTRLNGTEFKSHFSLKR